jgi:hypothetical protein
VNWPSCPYPLLWCSISSHEGNRSLRSVFVLSHETWTGSGKHSSAALADLEPVKYAQNWFRPKAEHPRQRHSTSGARWTAARTRCRRASLGPGMVDHQCGPVQHFFCCSHHFCYYLFRSSAMKTPYLRARQLWMREEQSPGCYRPFILADFEKNRK